MSAAVTPSAVVEAAVLRRRGGMTLTELMVSAAVMAILILAAGMIVTQTQKVVSTSEAMMRSNAQAAAIAQLLRTEMASVSRHGLLCITQCDGGAEENSAQWFAITAGPTAPVSPGVAGDLRALAALTGLGLGGETVVVAGTTTPTRTTHLWHAAWALDGVNFVDTPNRADWDHLPIDAANYQRLDRTTLNNCIPSVSSTNGPTVPIVPTEMPMPTAQTAGVDEVMRSWKFLSAGVTNLSITWTDDTNPADGIVWYGIENGVVNAKDKALPNLWSARNVATLNASGEYCPEFRTSAGKYRALWTHHNPSTWPKAIRFRFTLTQQAGLEQEYRSEHEVICPVGR